MEKTNEITHCCPEMCYFEITHDVLFRAIEQNPCLGLLTFDENFTNYGDSEYFWTNSDEYTSPVLFCPGCGLDLRTLLNKF